MGKFVVRVLINGLALWIASWILPGLQIVAGGTAEIALGSATAELILGYLFIGLIFGVVNALVRPIVRILALPVTILTLGLFTIIINAAMLALTAWISQLTPVELSIDSFFWTAVLGSLIISLVSIIAGTVTNTRK